MKINKLFIGLSLLTTIPVGFISSCSKSWTDYKNEVNDHTNFIKDRTFSFLGTGKDSSKKSWNVFGTAWIIADATANNSSDYSYYFATNMHVVRGWSKLNDFTLKYAADCSQTTNPTSIPIDSYIAITDYSEQEIKNIDSNTNFLYPNQKQDGQYLKSGIDFAYFKANLDESTMSSDIKTKLDKINSFNKTNGYICKFASIDQNSDSNSKKKYVGGYPYIGGSGKWECHSLAADELEYKALNYQYAKPQIGHAIGYPDKDQQGNEITYEDPSSTPPEAYYRYDVSPQYLSKAERDSQYLKAGASGSMLIDEDYNVVGIYWGGWEKSDNCFIPSYSLFNTPTKNFLPSII